MKLSIKKFCSISKLFMLSIILLLNGCDFLPSYDPKKPDNRRKRCLEQSRLMAVILNENGAIKEKDAAFIFASYRACNKPDL